MKYKKISITKIVGELGYKDWQKIQQEVNAISGFKSIFTDKELHALTNYKLSKLRRSSYENLHSAEFLLEKRTSACVDSFTIEFSDRVYLWINKQRRSISAFVAVFQCPECEKIYKVDCNPSRYDRKTSLCKKCQKKWLHKFTSYQENYENSMLKTYGVRRPLQDKKIRERMQQTMFDRHGVDFAMQSAEIRKHHAQSMMEKFGRDNFFRGINPLKEFQTFKERGFLSRFELSVSQCCIDIFGTHTLCCQTKKHKFLNVSDQKWYAPDFFDAKRNIIIEFNGDFFHANPEVYVNTTKLFNRGLTFVEIREREEHRFAVLRQHAKHVYVVWEKDWKVQPNVVLVMLKEIRDAYDKNTFVSPEKLLGWQPQQ